MPKPALDATFALLRGILATHSKHLVTSVDKSGDYQVASPTMKDRIGRPLFVAAVQTRKHYVSYHLMGVYVRPELLKPLSPDLKKRMQGKSCFNFSTVDQVDARELSALTKAGIEAFRDVPLPWAASKKRAAVPGSR